VYVSTIGKYTQVFIMDSSGAGKRRITDLPCPSYYPFFSPDDTQIVFMSYPRGEATVCIVDADGTGFRRLTPEDEENADPHWAPDGERIIFYSTRDGNAEIYTMDVNGGNWLRLTDHAASDQTPSYSPHGRHIVFVTNRDGNDELYLMGPDGSDVRRRTFDPRIDRVPSWSHDGSRIIWYVRESPEVAGSARRSWLGAELYEMRMDGTGRRRLTQNLHMDHGPVYSPDGRRIAFTSGRTGRREVFIMDADGENLKQLTFGRPD